MSEPWTTKQHAWVKEQYHQGRKVGEFWEEFEPIFGGEAHQVCVLPICEEDCH